MCDQIIRSNLSRAKKDGKELADIKQKNFVIVAGSKYNGGQDYIVTREDKVLSTSIIHRIIYSTKEEQRRQKNGTGEI